MDAWLKVEEFEGALQVSGRLGHAAFCGYIDLHEAKYSMTPQELTKYPKLETAYIPGAEKPERILDICTGTMVDAKAVGHLVRTWDTDPSQFGMKSICLEPGLWLAVAPAHVW